MDFQRKLSGFTDFEHTVDHGSAVDVDADSGLCLSCHSILGPKRNLDHRSLQPWSVCRVHPNFFFFFFRKSSLNSGVRLLCYFLHYLCEFTGNSGIHIYLSDLNKNTGGLSDLAKTRHGSIDLHTPIHSPRKTLTNLWGNILITLHNFWLTSSAILRSLLNAYWFWYGREF